MPDEVDGDQAELLSLTIVCTHKKSRIAKFRPVLRANPRFFYFKVFLTRLYVQLDKQVCVSLTMTISTTNVMLLGLAELLSVLVFSCIMYRCTLPVIVLFGHF